MAAQPGAAGHRVSSPAAPTYPGLAGAIQGNCGPDQRTSAPTRRARTPNAIERAGRSPRRHRLPDAQPGTTRPGRSGRRSGGRPWPRSPTYSGRVTSRRRPDPGRPPRSAQGETRRRRSLPCPPGSSRLRLGLQGALGRPSGRLERSGPASRCGPPSSRASRRSTWASRRYQPGPRRPAARVPSTLDFFCSARTVCLPHRLPSDLS